MIPLQWQQDHLKTVRYVIQHGLHLAEARGERWLMKAIPFYHLSYIFFLYVVTYIIVPRVMWYVVPLLLFYTSLALMIIGSLQQIWFQRLFKLYHVYSVMFKRSNRSLPVDSYEALFTVKHGLHAPIIFFLAFAVLIGVKPLANEGGIFSELLFFVCMAMSCLCFLSCSGYRLREIRSSMVLRLLSAVLGFVCVKGVLSGTILGEIFCEAWPAISIANTGISISIGPDSALLASSAALLVVAGARHGKASWLQVVAPHFFFLAWLKVAMLLLSTCTWSGFAKTVTAAAAIPFSPILISVVPVYLVSSSGVWAVGLVLLAMLLVGGAAILIMRYTNYQQAERWFAKQSLTTQIMALATAGLAIGVAVGLAHSSYSAEINPLLNQPVAPLNWSYYAERCMYESGTTAQRQLACRHFNHQLIEWTGTVADIQISKIDNNARSMLTSIPWGLGFYFYRLGFSSNTDCAKEDQEVDCLLHHRAMSGLDLLDVYQFSLKVDVSSPNTTLSLTTGNHRTQYIPHIQHGTAIRFRAVLSNAGSSGGPSLAAKRVTILDANGNELLVSQQSKEERSLPQEMERAGSAVLQGFSSFFLGVHDSADTDESMVGSMSQPQEAQ